jgi:hypothetical protein
MPSGLSLPFDHRGGGGPACALGLAIFSNVLSAGLWPKEGKPVNGKLLAKPLGRSLIARTRWIVDEPGIYLLLQQPGRRLFLRPHQTFVRWAG